jgi:uncharacterized protein YbbK (DUF523 family)
MIKKSVSRRLLAQLCQYRAQEAAEQTEAEERAERQQVMISTVRWQFAGLVTPAEAQRIREGRQV